MIVVWESQRTITWSVLFFFFQFWNLCDLCFWQSCWLFVYIKVWAAWSSFWVYISVCSFSLWALFFFFLSIFDEWKCVTWAFIWDSNVSVAVTLVCVWQTSRNITNMSISPWCVRLRRIFCRLMKVVGTHCLSLCCYRGQPTWQQTLPVKLSSNVPFVTCLCAFKFYRNVGILEISKVWFLFI